MRGLKPLGLGAGLIEALTLGSGSRGLGAWGWGPTWLRRVNPRYMAYFYGPEDALNRPLWARIVAGEKINLLGIIH